MPRAGVTPDVLVCLANLTLTRKPGRGPRAYPNPLISPSQARDALGVETVLGSDLAGLQALHALVVELIDELLAGRAPGEQVASLTALAQSSSARVRIVVGEAGELRQCLEWTDPSLVAGLARRIVLELGTVDRSRLRRCARYECDLVFYDTTRSNTRRWHAESPCGGRERQRRFRTARASFRAEAED